MSARWVTVLCLTLGLVSCTGDSEKGAEMATGPNADRGRRIYLVNCIACHNRDPAKKGATGPPIKGSSEALLQARVLHKSYPPGYVPKRKSNAMTPLPHLRKAIPDLAAFLR